MSHIQIELSDDEDEIIRTYMWLIGEDNKRSGLKKLIKYSKNIKEIGDAIKIRNKMGSKK
jgi:hypothetical protein